MIRRLLKFSAALLPLSLTDCGSVTPEIIRSPANERSVGKFVDHTALHVRCELRDAVKDAVKRRNADFLRKWSAKITMTLSAEEKLNLAPSATVADTFGGPVLKAINIGVGGSLNQSALRKIELTWYESFAELLSQDLGPCQDPPAPRINGDLRIRETLYAGVLPASSEGAFFKKFTDDAGPLESIQNTITFDVEVGASATPSFTLTKVMLNPRDPFILANRDRMDQLLITMGPGQIEKSGRKTKKLVVRPSRELIDAHNTGRLGLEVQTYFPRRVFP